MQLKKGSVQRKLRWWVRNIAFRYVVVSARDAGHYFVVVTLLSLLCIHLFSQEEHGEYMSAVYQFFRVLYVAPVLF
jgi:hypothetical protein